MTRYTDAAASLRQVADMLELVQADAPGLPDDDLSIQLAVLPGAAIGDRTGNAAIVDTVASALLGMSPSHGSRTSDGHLIYSADGHIGPVWVTVQAAVPDPADLAARLEAAQARIAELEQQQGGAQ